MSHPLEHTKQETPGPETLSVWSVWCPTQHAFCVWYSKPEKTVDKPSWQAPHQTGLFPVSVEWEPPFSMLVDLVGHGDHQVVSRHLSYDLIV